MKKKDVQVGNGTDIFFIRSTQTRLGDKENYVQLLEKKIEKLLQLSEIDRTLAVSCLLLLECKNGINHYFPHLINYASPGVAQFVSSVTMSEETYSNTQKVK